MTVRQTIEFIEKELSQILIDYNVWYEVESKMISYIPHTGWSIEQILAYYTY